MVQFTTRQRTNAKRGTMAASPRLCCTTCAKSRSTRPELSRCGKSLERTVMVRCDKAAAVASLQASKDGLSDHLESVAGKMKKSPGQFSATESQDLEDIEEIDQNNYYDKIAAADAPVVLIDFYTQWCGPCKLMYPQLVAMKGELEGKVTFYKFNCHKSNADLGRKLKIKVAPTFIFYKGGEEVKRLTGAKVVPLQDAIAELTA